MWNSIGLWADNYPLAVVKGYFIPVKDSSAQDVFVAEESNRHSMYRRESRDFKNAQVNGSKNGAAIPHL